MGNVGFVGRTMCEIKKTICPVLFCQFLILFLFVTSIVSHRGAQRRCQEEFGFLVVRQSDYLRDQSVLRLQITPGGDKQRKPSLSGRKCSRIRKLEADRSENCEQFASQFKSGR